MESSKTNDTTKNTISFPNKTKNKARRLLDRLKSPALFIASEIPLTQTPQSPLSLKTGPIAMEVENLSGGRFSLAKGQEIPDPNHEYYQYRLLKVLDHVCGHYSWVSISQMKVLGPEICAYCFEPLSLEHIGSKTDIKDFLLARTHGKVFFSQRNTVEYADLSDLFALNCIPCGGRGFESPLTWVIDTPWAGCPCCETKFRSQTT
jgi:hypothetical protein